MGVDACYHWALEDSRLRVKGVTLGRYKDKNIAYQANFILLEHAMNLHAEMMRHKDLLGHAIGYQGHHLSRWKTLPHCSKFIIQ
jgi:hypothetical protein